MDSLEKPATARLLLLVEDQYHADRLTKALMPEGYQFETLLFNEVQSRLSQLPEPDLSVLWFPYATPEALSAFEQLISSVRQLGTPTPVPVLLIIDKYGIDYIEPGFQLGISDILTRPIHPLVLRQRIRLLLQARQTEQAIARYQHSQQSLLQEKERFRTVADFTFDWEYWQDPQKKLLYNSPSCIRITGRAASEFIENPDLLLKIVHADDREMMRKHFQEEDLPQPATIDFRILRKDGQERWIGHACQPVFDSQKQPAGRRVSNRDITDRKNAELSVLHAERLAAMGRLTASLAHEINNPLQAMYSNIELISDFPLDDDERQKHLLVIRKETERLIRTVRSILDFARPQRSDPQRVSLLPVMEHAIELVHKKLSTAKIEIQLNIQPDLPFLFVSPDQLEQVCLNLIINAAEHMPQGGSISINAKHQADQISILFYDSGDGIDSQVLEWIFEPFYTTKTNGTGLGLSVSQNIIMQYGGRITASSQPGKGSTFTILLPVAEDA
jgi:PAS domain S-box-containing protein